MESRFFCTYLADINLSFFSLLIAIVPLQLPLAERTFLPCQSIRYRQHERREIRVRKAVRRNLVNRRVRKVSAYFREEGHEVPLVLHRVEVELLVVVNGLTELLRREVAASLMHKRRDFIHFHQRWRAVHDRKRTRAACLELLELLLQRLFCVLEQREPQDTGKVFVRYVLPRRQGLQGRLDLALRQLTAKNRCRAPDEFGVGLRPVTLREEAFEQRQVLGGKLPVALVVQERNNVRRRDAELTAELLHVVGPRGGELGAETARTHNRCGVADLQVCRWFGDGLTEAALVRRDLFAERLGCLAGDIAGNDVQRILEAPGAAQDL
eukprot:PhM_4_TR6733/c0_g1_i1/m.13914